MLGKYPIFYWIENNVFLLENNRRFRFEFVHMCVLIQIHAYTHIHILTHTHIDFLCLHTLSDSRHMLSDFLLKPATDKMWTIEMFSTIIFKCSPNI